MAWPALLASVEPRRPRGALRDLAHEHREAWAHLGDRPRGRPLCCPARFLGPATRAPGGTAVEAAASPSHGAPHRRPSPRRSGCAGDHPRGEVRRWPPGRTAPAGSRAPPGPGTKRPAPPAGGRERGSACPPHRLVAWLPSGRAGPHTPCDPLAPQGAWRALAARTPLPGVLAARLAPRRHAWPEPRWLAAPAAGP